MLKGYKLIASNGLLKKTIEKNTLTQTKKWIRRNI